MSIPGGDSEASLYLSPKLLSKFLCLYRPGESMCSTAPPDPTPGQDNYTRTFTFESLMWRRASAGDRITLRVFSSVIMGKPEAFNLRRGAVYVLAWLRSTY